MNMVIKYIGRSCDYDLFKYYIKIRVTGGNVHVYNYASDQFVRCSFKGLTIIIMLSLCTYQGEPGEGGMPKVSNRAWSTLRETRFSKKKTFHTWLWHLKVCVQINILVKWRWGDILIHNNHPYCSRPPYSTYTYVSQCQLHILWGKNHHSVCCVLCKHTWRKFNKSAVCTPRSPAACWSWVSAALMRMWSMMRDFDKELSDLVYKIAHANNNITRGVQHC